VNGEAGGWARTRPVRDLKMTSLVRRDRLRAAGT
jgi:hypothetical protein